MAHFGSTVRNIIKSIIGLGSNFYPESLWRLYLINAPMVFRAIWRAAPSPHRAAS